MANEGTKRQLSDFFHKAYEESRNPDINDRKVQKVERLKRRVKVSKKFGL